MEKQWKFRQLIFGVISCFAFLIAFSGISHAAGYTYTSKEYGYSIECPVKPLGVVPLSVLSPGEKGDILVFANEGYDIKYAWVIMPDAFEETSLPDLDKISEADAKALFSKMLSNGYAFVSLVHVNGHNGLYAVTSKEIFVGKDKEGKPEKVETDEQQIKTFLRGKNHRFGIVLMDNPTLVKEHVDAYQSGVLTFKETE